MRETIPCGEFHAVRFNHTSSTQLINNNFFFLSTLILGMIACYTIEYSTRRDFYLARLLEKEQRNVRTINDQLEIRVQQRTAQLEKANLELKQEMEERRLWEEERQKLEERLMRAEKMEALGTLAGGVAHDLNNVLAGLVSYPDLLLEDIPESDSLYAPLNTIKNSGEKAAAIVLDLLTLARKGVMVLEVLCLNDGLETDKRILKLHPGQKAIITSGFAETRQVKEAQQLGAGKYIRKPYILEKIGLAVHNAISSSQGTSSI